MIGYWGSQWHVTDLISLGYHSTTDNVSPVGLTYVADGSEASPDPIVSSGACP
jgi:hypothetical protein